MVHTAYNIASEDVELLEEWIACDDKPALLLTLPSMRDVGEHELVEELCERSYERAGYVDDRTRHKLLRSWPRDGTLEEYARFVDEPLLAAEITNEFCGVDCIDLTDWSDQDVGYPSWKRLLESIHPEKGHDYVFLVYAARPQATQVLARSIMSRCGIATLPVQLLPPTPEALTKRFIEEAPDLRRDGLNLICDWLEDLVETGRTPNFAYVDAVASAVSGMCVSGDGGQLQRMLDLHTALAPTIGSDKRIGF